MDRIIALILGAAAGLCCGSASCADIGLRVWRNVGPGGGGWIESVTASCHDRRRVLVGCDVGGFYMSADGGESYCIQNAGLTDYFIESIVEDPANANVIYVAGPGGIHKSCDAGRHWRRLGNGFPKPGGYYYSCRISKLCIDRSHPDTLYAATGHPRDVRMKGRGEIWKTTDAGEGWKRISAVGALPEDLNILDFSLDPADPSRMLICAYRRGVFLSSDGGVTWRLSNRGLPRSLSVRKLARAPSHPQRVYVTLSAEPEDGDWQAGVYRSDDGGCSWAPCNDGLCQQMGETSRQCGWVCPIVVDPKDKDIVYAGSNTWIDSAVYKTTDGGKSWKRVFDGKTRGWISFWGPGPQALTISTFDSNVLYFGTSGGVFMTLDAGKTWRPCYSRDNPDGSISSTGLEVTCLHRIMPHPTVPGRVYFGYYDIGLFRSDDNGQTFRRCMSGVDKKFENSCTALAFDPVDGEHLWGAFGQWGAAVGTILESRDGGRSWSNPGGETATTAPSGRCRGLFFKDGVLTTAVLGHGVSQSFDGGMSWSGVQGLPEMKRIGAMAMDGEMTYVGLSGSHDAGASVWRSADGCRTWMRVGDSNLPALTVYGLDVRAGMVFLAARSEKGRNGGIWKLDGKEWSCVRAADFGHAVAIDPFDARHVYATFADHPYHDGAIGEGVFESHDGGHTWASANSPKLTCRNATCVAPDPFRRNAVWVGTSGNSAFYGVCNK